ncbi:hypothetical protein GCU56_01180 [Geodermatophilus sabuli]|uniref:Uncharacterized protein n=1 Tax=Geodermatophilus sabuli TaxID=1564158 RepID=A0A7K3VVY3_9ACTN|nr:hypothetical protein [Geodermatophilus sabuli]NEK56488.1 hypothetical protein [Geodermatophilus sabuli]
MTLAVPTTRTAGSPAGRGDAVDRIIAAVAADPAPRLTGRAPAGGAELADRIRRAAMDVELATVLTVRAERLGNPVLASMLRERAAVRRGRAERIRADLAARGVITHRAA